MGLSSQNRIILVLVIHTCHFSFCFCFSKSGPRELPCKRYLHLYVTTNRLELQDIACSGIKVHHVLAPRFFPYVSSCQRVQLQIQNLQQPLHG